MQEMIVAKEQGIDLSIIVLNESNKKQQQKSPDYKLMGESFGVKSFKIKSDNNIRQNLSKYLNHKGLRLIEIAV